MNDMTPDRDERRANLKGLGTSRKRVEDARFTQGKGNYVDDIKLDGMLHGDFVRSPYAHARIKSINTDAAMALDGVLAVLTAKDLEPLGLHWMPTLAGDKQMVLADGKVLFQGQEVAYVVAKDRYIAADGAELVEVEYEELPVLVDPFEALKSDVVLREDLDPKADGAHGPRKHHNHIFTWEVGEKEATEEVIDASDVVAEEMIYYHRTHPCPLETCGCVASMDKVNGKLTLYGTFQAPHAIRTVVSLISGLEEDNIRVISPDIGGGFGNKVGAYPGYVCSVVASIVTGLPVKWVEDRMENLMTTAFVARDYWMKGKISATKEGKITGLWCHTTADHGGFDACADPTKFPAGFMNICTGSYDIPTAYLAVDGVYTNKAPGGVAYRCSFRVTEAAYFIERMIEVLAIELNIDAAELRRINFITQDQFPYTSALGWEYDSGDYHMAWDKALKAVGYDDLRKEQSQRVEDFKAGKTRKLLGIGLTHFTEIVGAGPVKNCDILGLGMFDSCEIRIHLQRALRSLVLVQSVRTRPCNYFWQILASEIGLPADSITIEEGDTDTAPYGLGTYGSRSTPVVRQPRLWLEENPCKGSNDCSLHAEVLYDDDVEFDVDRFVVKGAPERFKTMKEIAFAAYNQAIPGIEPGLEAVSLL